MLHSWIVAVLQRALLLMQNEGLPQATAAYEHVPRFSNMLS